MNASRMAPGGREEQEADEPGVSIRKSAGGFLTNYFRGHDYFISYRKKESYAYAKRLAEVLEGDHHFDCYMDERLLPLGEPIKPFLRSQLRRSRMLILIATPGVAAPDSDYVPFELGVFARTRRKIAAVYVGDADEKIPYDQKPWSTLAGRRHYAETESAILAGDPSPVIVEELVSSFTYTRQDVATRRKVRVVQATGAIVAIVGLVMITYGLWIRSNPYQIRQVLSQVGLLTEMDPDTPYERKAARRFLGVATLCVTPGLRRTPIDAIEDPGKKVPDSTVFCVRIKNRVVESKAIPSNSCWCVKFVPKNEAG